jgi:hypothetical protein
LLLAKNYCQLIEFLEVKLTLVLYFAHHGLEKGRLTIAFLNIPASWLLQVTSLLTLGHLVHWLLTPAMN